LKILVGIAIGVLWERQIQKDYGRSIVEIMKKMVDNSLQPPAHLKPVK
jgi:hypothetical protein